MKRFVFLTGIMMLFVGCSDDHSPHAGDKPEDVNVNHNPVILKIDIQTVKEGEIFKLDLNGFVSEPDRDPITIEKISGPGDIAGSVYVYQDNIDNDNANNGYVINFKARDDSNGEASGYFQLIQQDWYYAHQPVVLNIENQTVEEGKLFFLDLRRYIVDIANDIVSIEKLSGPGEIINRTYSYQDTEDEDFIQNTYFVEFKVTDSMGDFAVGSFWLIQNDQPPPELLVISQKLSSGIDALLIDNIRDIDNQCEYQRSQVSLAIDNNNLPIIVYSSIHKKDGSSYPGTYYAKTNGSKWYGDIVIGYAGFTYIYPNYYSMAMDKNNSAHLCFDGWSCGEQLRYAIFNNWKWTNFVVDDNCSVGLINDITIDSKGKAHISYWDWVNKVVKYATNSAGEWRFQDIDSAAWLQTSITVDKSDNIHIAFINSRILYHAYNIAGNWEKEIISDGQIDADAPHGTFLRADSQNLLHIVYFTVDKKSIHHSVNRNGAWEDEVVVSYANEDINIKHWNRLAMAFGPDGSISMPFAASADECLNGKLYLATNISGNWKIHLLDDRDAYANPFIVIDHQGFMHLAAICLLGSGKAVVKYATFDPVVFK